jgi:hypothetical protein
MARMEPHHLRFPALGPVPGALVRLLATLLVLAPAPGGAQLQPVSSAGDQVRVGAWIQPAYRYQAVEEAEDRTGFFLRRARLDITGQLLEGRIRFRLLPDLAFDGSTRDAWVEVRGPSGTALRMGQQIVPHHLQRERSMGRAHFGDRALATRRFEVPGGRDVGIVGMWRHAQGRAFLQAGAFNGRGMNRPEPTRAPLLSARGGVSFGGPPANSETDLARTSVPVVTLSGGTAGARRSLLRPTPGIAPEAGSDWWNWTADLHGRYRGISLVAAWFDQHVTREGTPSLPKVRGDGWYLSAGWVFPRHDVELAARHSEATWDRDREDAPTRETGAGVTFFHLAHQLQTRVQLHRVRASATSGVPSRTVLTVEHQILLGG